jgi:hypothetical protein
MPVEGKPEAHSLATGLRRLEVNGTGNPNRSARNLLAKGKKAWREKDRRGRITLKDLPRLVSIRMPENEG